MFLQPNLFIYGFVVVIAIASLGNRVVVMAKDGECDDDSDCILLRSCCVKTGANDNVCKVNCIGESCTDASDCALGKCCHSTEKKCKYTCLNTKLEEATGVLTGWLLIVVIVGSILVVLIPVFIIVCCCCCCGAAASNRAPTNVTVLPQPVYPAAAPVVIDATNKMPEQYPMH